MPNLNLDQVSSNQNQKEVTINDQADQIDSALTDRLVLDLSAAGVTLTADQWTRNWFFEMGGHTVARTVTLPPTKRPGVVKNAGTGVLTLQVLGGGSAVVQPAQTVMIYNDGANLTVSGGGLSDAPADGKTYGRKDGGWTVFSGPVTADTKPLAPSDWDDEFEYGTVLDTTGVRRAGAKAWSVMAGASGDANPVKAGWITTLAVLKASMVAPVGAFKIRGKFTIPGNSVSASSAYAGLYVVGPSSGAGMTLYDNSSKAGTDVCKTNTSLVWASDLSVVATGAGFFITQPWYYEIEYDGTNVSFRISANGTGFRTLYTGTAVSLLGGAPTLIAIYLQDLGANGAGACCDWIRRVA